MEANGWNWFRIGLDNGDGTVDQLVRFLTPPTWGYDTFDNIVAQITVEVSPDLSCREGNCKVYECGAFENAITAFGPDSYWKMTDGVAGTSGVLTQFTGLVLDAAGTVNLNVVDGGTAPFDPDWTPPPMPSCSGTSYAYSSSSGGLDTGPGSAPYFALPTYNNLNGEGTMLAVWRNINDQDPLGGDFTVQWWITSGIYTSVTISNMQSGSASLRTETAGTPVGGPPMIAESTNNVLPNIVSNADGGTMAVVTWHEDGPDTTEVIAYNANGVEIFRLSGLRGRIGGFNAADPQRSERVTIGFGHNAFQDVMFKQSFSSAVVVKSLTDAWQQNQSTYQDPRPGCQ